MIDRTRQRDAEGICARQPRVAGIAALAAALCLLGGVLAGGSAAAGPDASASVRANRLSDSQLVGERLIVGFNGTSVPAALRDRIKHGGLAGVILFSANISSRDGVRHLIHQLQAIPRPARLSAPLLIMVDQEGGLVKRLSGAPCCLAETMGGRGADFSLSEGVATGRNLAGIGFNVDLAPVLDVARSGSAIGAEHRAFGGTRTRVSNTANPFARGLQRHNVVATAKHFPGLGAAKQNTDFASQRINLSRSKLRGTDEYPYHGFVGLHGRMVMLSTAIYPAFSNRPAAITRALATGELRGHLGFAGVSITDALGTVAAGKFGGPAALAVKGAAAGDDLLLYTSYQEGVAASGALRKTLRNGTIARQNFVTSAQRVLDLRARIARGAV